MNPPVSKANTGAGEAPASTAGISHEQLLLRTLIDNLPDCIYAKDAAGKDDGQSRRSEKSPL